MEQLSWRFWQKRRYIVVLMAFFGFFNVYSLRVNLSVGIVAMTENRTIYYENGTVGHVRISNLNFHFNCRDQESLTIICYYNSPNAIGTRIPVGFKRSWFDFELFLLWLYFYTVTWRITWI